MPYTTKLSSYSKIKSKIMEKFKTDKKPKKKTEAQIFDKKKKK